MSARRGRPAGETSAPRVLMSAPWIVVFLGVGLLAGLLVIALVSLRGEETPVVPAAVDPPIYLPTLGAGGPSATPSRTPARPAADPTESPTASPTASASPEDGATRSATPGPAASAAPRDVGTVTARYEPTASGRNWFEARLTVTNGSGRSQGWTVELYFTGNVKSIQATSASGVSASTQGSGVFVLRSAGPLAAGRSDTVQLRFSRSGTGDRPGQCTVNGTDCVIG